MIKFFIEGVFMSLYKKFVLFLAIISAVLCIFIVVDTYAKYMTSAKQVTNIPIAKWNIKVNNVSIKNNQDFLKCKNITITF